MKKSIYNKNHINLSGYYFTLLLLLISATLFGYSIDKQEFKKKISKEFTIGSKGEVALYNKYGKIEVKTSTNNKVTIDIEIVVNANSEKTAQETFDRINFDFYNNENYVKAMTVIESKVNWGWNNNNVDYSINYYVNMPSSCRLDLNNKYGDSYVSFLDASAKIDVKYGNFKMDGLSDNLMVTLGYGNGTVDQCKDLNAGISYGKLSLKESRNVAMETKYSDINISKGNDIAISTKYDTYTIGNVKRVSNTGKYDHFNIMSADDIAMTSDYTDVKVSNLTNSCAFNLSYGELSLKNISKDFKFISVDASYTDVSIDVEENAIYSFYGSSSYGDIKFPSNMNVSANNNSSNSKYVEGYFGTKNNKSKITVKASYGDIKLK